MSIRRERKDVRFPRGNRALLTSEAVCVQGVAKMGGGALELHHILSRAKFPQLVDMEENIMVLCHECHKEIHCNPFLNASLMERKAAELHVDLTILKIKN